MSTAWLYNSCEHLVLLECTNLSIVGFINEVFEFAFPRDCYLGLDEVSDCPTYVKTFLYLILNVVFHI